MVVALQLHWEMATLHSITPRRAISGNEICFVEKFFWQQNYGIAGNEGTSRRFSVWIHGVMASILLHNDEALAHTTGREQPGEVLPCLGDEEQLRLWFDNALRNLEIRFVVSPGDGWDHATFSQDETDELFRDLQHLTLLADEEVGFE